MTGTRTRTRSGDDARARNGEGKRPAWRGRRQRPGTSSALSAGSHSPTTSFADTLDRPECGSSATPQPTTQPGYLMCRRQRSAASRDSPHPASILDWKVEGNEPPYLILSVPARWLQDVVRPGYAVLDD